MEIETAQIGIALASYVAGIASNWWWENRKKVLGNIEETLEDKIEELTGLDIELGDVVDEIASSAEEVAAEAVEAVESGASLEEIKDTIVESAQDEAFEMVEELSAPTPFAFFGASFGFVTLIFESSKCKRISILARFNDSMASFFEKTTFHL